MSATEWLALALVVVTGVYAYLTRGIMKATGKSVDAMERQTESLTRPYVTVSPMTIPGSPILFLRISNTGRTAAQALQLKMDKSFYRFGCDEKEENLSAFSAFAKQITSFAPGSELVFALAKASVVFADDADNTVTPRVFKVSARYSFGGHTVEESTEVDLRPYRGMHMCYDPTVSELEGIKKALEK